MDSFFNKARSKIKKILLLTMPTIFWRVFSIKRLLSRKKHFGFLSSEFFAEKFINDKVCDIGGFGMTAKVISQYYNHGKNKDFEATALFNRTLPMGAKWRFNINDSSVLAIPDLGAGYVKNFLTYSFHVNRSFNFLLSIDLYPGYEFSLSTMPNVPLMIWLRDPKGEVELEKIGTLDSEILANKMSNLEEFKTFARKERDFFSKIYERSLAFGRPIIFVTNAHCLTPRAKRLYELQEMKPFFLPNPINYPPLERIKKSQRPIVSLLGRLDPVKRPWIFFELAKKFKHVDFLVCGQSSYPQVMDPIIEKYRSVENLKFLGLVQGDEKVDILCRSWVLLNTSIHEGLPCSFLEAFSCHTPVLSSVNPDDLVGQFGIYTGENSGDGLDAKTLEQFRAGLDKMLSDKRALEEKGAQARMHIKKIYTFEMFEKNLHTILVSRFRRNFER